VTSTAASKRRVVSGDARETITFIGSKNNCAAGAILSSMTGACKTSFYVDLRLNRRPSFAKIFNRNDISNHPGIGMDDSPGMAAGGF
jgi:hypothetical protein